MFEHYIGVDLQKRFFKPVSNIDGSPRVGEQVSAGRCRHRRLLAHRRGSLDDGGGVLGRPRSLRPSAQIISVIAAIWPLHAHEICA